MAPQVLRFYPRLKLVGLLEIAMPAANSSEVQKFQNAWDEIWDAPNRKILDNISNIVRIPVSASDVYTIQWLIHE